MGWLELLPLMRRLLPMLSQLTPMLESAVAGRAGARAEAEQTKAAVAGLANSHTDLLQRLDQQDLTLSELRQSLRDQVAVNNALLDRISTIEKRLGAMQAILRAAVLFAVLGVLVGVVVLAVLLARLH